MKQKLIILSDLWGKAKADYLSFYSENLNDQFDIVVYDCRVLAKLRVNECNEKNLHTQFINGGIDKAVLNLFNLEKGKVNILGFSVGGVIAWKYALKTSNVTSFYAVSATRLRLETNKPKGKIHLFYGENDVYKPNKKWFLSLDIQPSIIPKKGHEVYSDPKFAKKLCNYVKTRNCYE